MSVSGSELKNTNNDEQINHITTIQQPYAAKIFLYKQLF